MAKSIIIDPEKYANLLIRDLEKARAEGYRAGRIAALREVGCLHGDTSCADFNARFPKLRHPRIPCIPCRLLAEAESGEDTGAG